MQSCLLFDLVLLRPLPLTSSALLSSLTLLLQLGKQLTLLFTQARPILLPLSKPLEAGSKVQWSLHFLAHEDTTSTKIVAGRHPATSLDAL